MERAKPNLKKPVLLMVDDDEEDVYLIQRAFCAYQPNLVFNSTSNSEGLFDYLYSRGTFANRSKKEDPHVILLDINIPQENGFEILKKLKENSTYSTLPVIMLSTSSARQDIEKAYSLGANSYITKSVTASGTKQIAEQFCQYWFGLSNIPDAK